MFYERKNTRKVCVNFQPNEEDHEAAVADGYKGPPRCKGCNYLESEHFNCFQPKPWTKVKTWRSDLHLDNLDFGQTGINKKIKSVFVLE